MVNCFIFVLQYFPICIKVKKISPRPAYVFSSKQIVWSFVWSKFLGAEKVNPGLHIPGTVIPCFIWTAHRSFRLDGHASEMELPPSI